MRKVSLEGKVLYANAKPARDVTVRVFDADNPARGNPDDDLTVRPGTTEASGEFSVDFDMDRNPERIDLFRPYARFTYRVNGREREHRRDLVFILNLQTEVDMGSVILPEYEPVPYAPGNNGFRFINSFKGIPLIDIPIGPFDSQAHGLCGGMSYSSADFAVFGRKTPDTKKTPGKNTALYHYLFQRQMDSFGAAFSNLFKLQNLMGRPDGTVKGTQKASYDEFLKVRKKLDAGQLVPLYVILDRKVLWNCHQVLAYNYTEIPGVSAHISIYDPNMPENDDVAIHCETVDVGTGGTKVPGHSCRIVDAQYGERMPYAACFGYFDSGYVPKYPPQDL